MTLYLNNKEGDFNVYTPEQYGDFFKNREPGEFNGRVGEILDIDMVRDIATAKVYWLGKRFGLEGGER